jgi:predicted Zn-dependent protease
MIRAGYDPNALIRVMEVLKKASAGRVPPEFLSTHPDPANRVERIKEAIRNAQQASPPAS